MRVLIPLILSGGIAAASSAQIALQDPSVSQAAEFHRDAGRRLLQAGQLEDAEREFLRALALDPSQDDVLLDLTRLHIRSRQWQESDKDVHRYLRAHPQSTLALGLAGEVKFREHDFREARRYLTQVIKLKPDDGMAHKLLALCYGAEDRWEKALPHLSHAVRLLPHDEEAHYWRGRALVEMGKYQEAIGEFEATLEIRPNYVKAFDNLGLCYDRLSKYDLAIENYRRAVELDRQLGTRYVWPYINLASLLNHLRRYRESVELLGPVAQWDTPSAAVAYHLGRARLALGQLDRAEADLLRASRLDPSLALPHYQLAELYKKEGKRTEARRQLEIFSRLAIPSQGNRTLY
jgi:tetratricopeptide (TPR) repeat protein